MTEYDLSDPAVRYHAPRGVPVTREVPHCAPGCVHLREARLRGFEEGARAERERVDREGIGCRLLVPMLAVVAAALATVVALLRWAG